MMIVLVVVVISINMGYIKVDLYAMMDRELKCIKNRVNQPCIFTFS